MAPASRSSRLSDWREIASLGEQIVNADSLAEQRDHIIARISRLIKGEIDVWLCEQVFRLPNLEDEGVFPEAPELLGMKRAVKAGQVRTKQPRGKVAGIRRPPRQTWAAVPMIEKGLVLGALQVTRKK